MTDILMIALMIAAIAVFAGYVTCCDRIIGRVEPDTRAHRATALDAPAEALERAA